MYIDDLFQQKKVQISYERYKKCECTQKQIDCSRCKGKGYSSDLTVCSCRGGKRCNLCSNSIAVKEKMNISWAPGKFFKNGQIYKFPNMGNYDLIKEKYRDVSLRLNILTDNNLTITASSVESVEMVPLSKMVLGGVIEIDTIWGRKEVKLASGIQPDDYKIVDKKVILI
jgi:DnaJ-class molecular chaperone